MLLLAGCDLLGDDESFDVPPERRVVMTAVYEETLPGGRPVHRLVLADVENPSTHEVLSAAGRDAGRSCFGPEKRRLLFEDNSESNVGSRAPIKLLDLESREVRDLGVTGTLKGCVWRADGSGFYFAAEGLAGAKVSTFYNLKTDNKTPFAQSEVRPFGGLPWGRNGQDSILVSARDTSSETGSGFYFVDEETETYLTKVENEHFKIVPWEDPDRGGNKYSVFTPAYNDKRELIAFRLNSPEHVGDLAVTSPDGEFFNVYGASSDYIDSFPKWGPANTVLFRRKEKKSTLFQTHRVMVANVETGKVKEFVEPETIDGAVALRLPDY